MQEAQASCVSGGPVSSDSDSPSISLQVTFPPRPSISLELFDRFVKSDSAGSVRLRSDAMDIELDDALSGVPPCSEDAIVTTCAQLSSRPGTAVSCDKAFSKKNPSKRELSDATSPSVSAKKPSPTSSVESKSSSNTASAKNANQYDNTLAATKTNSVLPSYRYNSKDLPPYIVQVQSIQESDYSHPLHISRTISNILP